MSKEKRTKEEILTELEKIHVDYLAELKVAIENNKKVEYNKYGYYDNKVEAQKNMDKASRKIKNYINRKNIPYRLRYHNPFVYQNILQFLFPERDQNPRYYYQDFFRNTRRDGLSRSNLNICYLHTKTKIVSKNLEIIRNNMLTPDQKIIDLRFVFDDIVKGMNYGSDQDCYHLMMNTDSGWMKFLKGALVLCTAGLAAIPMAIYSYNKAGTVRFFKHDIESTRIVNEAKDLLKEANPHATWKSEQWPDLGITLPF